MTAGYRLNFPAATIYLVLASIAPVSTVAGQQLDEIVVTVQKREQVLRDVPLAVSVFTEEQIRQSAIVKFEDYADLTPGFFVEQGADERTYEISIRGVSPLGGTAASFGLYLDEFELTGARQGNANADLTDIARIEVLRGPQGTTFGRNVIAGAVNLTSIKPHTDALTGYVELEGANHSSWRARGAMNVPLVDDVAAARVSASFRTTDGYLTNLGPSGQSNDSETSGVRAAFRLTPNERLTVDAALAVQAFDQGHPNTVYDGNLLGTVATIVDIVDGGIGGVPPGTFPAPQPLYPAQNEFISTDTLAFSEDTTTLYTLRGQYDFNNFSLVSVSGYVHNESSSLGDFDDSAFNVTIGETPFSEADFWSTELRLQSGGESRVDWVAGLYYSEATSESHSRVTFGDDAEVVTFVNDGMGGFSLFPNNQRLFDNMFDNEESSFAAFGEVGYDITDRVTLTAGLRYNDDEISQAVTDSFNLLEGGPLPDAMEEASFDKLTWRTSLTFAASDTVNLYGTVALGYRAGGLQLRSTAVPEFGPEEANNYEVGAKAFLWDRRASFNVAAFYTDFRDVQILTFDFSTGGEITDNVGRADITGLEVELRAEPFDGLLMFGGLAWIDAEIVDYINAVGDSFAGFRMPNTPEWSGNFTLDYSFAVSAALDAFVRPSVLYVGDRLESVVDANEQEFLDSYTRIDISAGIRGESWTVEAFGENVFDEIYQTGVLLSGFSLAGSGVTSPRPVYGIRAMKEF